jgi:hypothetical protein
MDVASSILKKKGPASHGTFKKYFKLSCQLVDALWKKLHVHFPEDNARELLWTLHFLKTTNTDVSEIAKTLGTSRETLTQQVKNVLNHLDQILPRVCSK